MNDPEFSRPIRLDTLGDGLRRIAIDATEVERAALARRFGLLAIERLEAEAEVHIAGETVLASGRLQAAVTQACVASGEPIEAKVDEPFALKFVPEIGGADDEVELEESDLDVVAYEGNVIDLGEAVAQSLMLALDPFPRAANADDVLRQAGVIGEHETGPFAILKGLKNNL